MCFYVYDGKQQRVDVASARFMLSTRREKPVAATRRQHVQMHAPNNILVEHLDEFWNKAMHFLWHETWRDLKTDF